MTVNVTAAQEAVCARFGMQPVPADPSAKVGISRSVQDGLVPLNGLRHRPEQGTTGWFIWAGEELSDRPDFFVPLHVEHFAEWCPQALDFLALPPGSRFLLAPTTRTSGRTRACFRPEASLRLSRSSGLVLFWHLRSAARRAGFRGGR